MHRGRPLLLAVLLLVAFAEGSRATAPSAIPPEAYSLRDVGLAELQNDRPEAAAVAFEGVVELLPDDPLGHANLAIVALATGDADLALRRIDAAIERDGRTGALLAIRARALEQIGAVDRALTTAEQARELRPGDPVLAFQVFSLARQVESEAARRAEAGAVRSLLDLRPENLVVWLEGGRSMLDGGDRAGATRIYLRLRELAPGLPEASGALIATVLEALEAGDLEAARTPARKLANLGRASDLYRAGIAEIASAPHGEALVRFRGEASRRDFGTPVAVRFEAELLSDEGPVGASLVVRDLDGDGGLDVARARVVSDGGAEAAHVLLLHDLAGATPPRSLPSPPLVGLESFDLDNDGRLDLVGHGPSGLVIWRGTEEGFVEATEAFGATGLAAVLALAPVDFDLEGDLDLALLTAPGDPGPSDGGDSARIALVLLRNTGAGRLERVAGTGPAAVDGASDLVASDLDLDGDPDLLLPTASGLRWLRNDRRERWTRMTHGSLQGEELTRVRSADLDNRGHLDLLALGDAGVAVLSPVDLEEPGEATRARIALAGVDGGADVLPFDGDNDGRLDLAVLADGQVRILMRRAGGGMHHDAVEISGAPRGVRAMRVLDRDGDGDLDLVLGGAAGLHWLRNEGGNSNRWMAVELQGLTTGNSKNNVRGVGARLELRAEGAMQLRESTGEPVHFGLGRRARADVLRVLWPNGVLQNRVRPEANQLVVEEQGLKGSCPFLYAWDGTRFRFVTDLLWGSPLGLPLAAGVWAAAQPDELVAVPGAQPREGLFELRITEELWEAAFFDRIELMVVDHPRDVEVASSLRIGAGVPGDELRASAAMRPVERAWDGSGADVTERVRERDGHYASGFERSPYQGIAAQPWTTTLDLGRPPAGAFRLHLDGWIFPSDASGNIALGQRPDLGHRGPVLEAQVNGSWRAVVDPMGFPPGKTKTIVVDVPALPEGTHLLRIRSNLWLGWDRIAVSEHPVDAGVRIRARLRPLRAELRHRGFSELVRESPNGPHGYRYEAVRVESPWLPFPGHYTRYGDVRPLLARRDDRTVILAAGDELALSFDGSHLPDPAPGETRSLFLHSSGWDKDADRNTWAADRVEPLPFHGMSGYPYAAGESYPEGRAHRAYRADWLTREVGR